MPFTGAANVERAVFAGLGVLIMGYPCAVGIAAPLAIVRGAGEAADLGIIMRTGEAFQAFGSATHVVLDKTGTLTEGRPVVREVEALGDPGELLAVAAAAESAAQHPLAQAMTDAAFERGLALPEPDDFDSITGFGVTATLQGRRVLVGRPDFLADNGVDLSMLRDRLGRRHHRARRRHCDPDRPGHQSAQLPHDPPERHAGVLVQRAGDPRRNHRPGLPRLGDGGHGRQRDHHLRQLPGGGPSLLFDAITSVGRGRPGDGPSGP